jgi:hypothetical protein
MSKLFFGESSKMTQFEGDTLPGILLFLGRKFARKHRGREEGGGLKAMSPSVMEKWLKNKKEGDMGDSCCGTR